jgi:hypothetical protein
MALEWPAKCGVLVAAIRTSMCLKGECLVDCLVVFVDQDDFFLYI